VRRGVWIFPSRPVAELVEAIVAAEEAGLDEVWLADEGVAREPVTVLAAAATRTVRIRLATGITSPILRHPGAIAASLATLDELSAGRAVLGLGVGGRLSLEPFGLRTDRPVAVVRDAIEIARAVLRRDASARYDPPSHAIPARDVPIPVRRPRRAGAARRGAATDPSRPCHHVTSRARHNS
jgi:alkanesulfonate monooxygenase SsuD/methylene tetrahydromethanopterin reductase-like flavin-dependent oxidoreductase (luciferase family)